MKERIDALETALENERQEKEFYRINAARTQNPLGKVMFARIAEEEGEHEKMIIELHAVWSKGGKWPETVPLAVGKTKVPDILKDFVKQAKQAPAADADDLAALKKAIEFEGKGASFYARLRDAVSDPSEKAFFDLLATIEHEHYLSLKETEEYFTNPAAWFRQKEKGGLDGA
ncbi:MAG TPA: ferritin family protein [Syntrophales bacterium]|nr:ferritin family protein [Syntrophales bacterium]HOL58857.1 ferritin family protein [Syntrophales bacterium]HPO35184.1 ferritin family protein [Syntrophales bacterium]